MGNLWKLWATFYSNIWSHWFKLIKMSLEWSKSIDRTILIDFLSSVTRWTNYFPKFWPFTAMKIGPMVQKISIVGSKFGQILNKPSKNYPKTLQNLPKWQNVANSGHTVSKLKGKKKANATNWNPNHFLWRRQFFLVKYFLIDSAMQQSSEMPHLGRTLHNCFT